MNRNEPARDWPDSIEKAKPTRKEEKSRPRTQNGRYWDHFTTQPANYSHLAMILRFEIENLRSFHEPVQLLMTPGLERQHTERISRHSGTNQRVLPTAAVYGGNASGKSNLIESAMLLQHLIVDGTQPEKVIPRRPFKLDSASIKEPTRISIDFIALDDRIYSYSISFTDEEVVRETLTNVRPASEKVIFDRRKGQKRFDVSGLESLTQDKERRAFLRFTAEGTRPNQPFLHEAADRDVTELAPVYGWFSTCLMIIGPESRPITLEDYVMHNEDFRTFFRDRIRGADTGIHDIEAEDRPLDEVTDIPKDVREQIRRELKPNEAKLVRTGRGQALRFLARYRDGEIKACLLRATRLLENGETVAFDADEESDGTRRYMDLALAFYSLNAEQSRKVILVDELDRSLHPVLCRSAVESFLGGCDANSRTQFIITTHDVTLMTQEIFRRDELWLMEKDTRGASKLFSLGEFADLRNDKDLRRNYLQGRFGGVPVVTHHENRLTKTIAS